jgi:hypothetical protein
MSPSLVLITATSFDVFTDVFSFFFSSAAKAALANSKIARLQNFMSTTYTRSSPVTRDD